MSSPINIQNMIDKTPHNHSKLIPAESIRLGEIYKDR